MVDSNRKSMGRVLVDAPRDTFVIHSKDARHTTLALYLNVLMCHSLSFYRSLVICKVTREHHHHSCRFYDDLFLDAC